MPAPARLDEATLLAYRIKVAKEMEARLAAAENVVEAARVSSQHPIAGMDGLHAALAAYDAHKKDTP